MNAKISFDRLREFIACAFIKLGMPEADARIVAALMAEADLQGSDGHGVIRLAQYARRIRAGGVNLSPQIKVMRERAGMALLDGDNGMGHLVMRRAAQMAVDKARSTGIAWVGSQFSNHAGPASLYARMALPHDMIGLYFAVGNANHLPPWGGLDMLLSTNPIAVAIPAGEEPAVVLDMATTVAAYGKVKAKAQRGEMMPDGYTIGGFNDSIMTMLPNLISKLSWDIVKDFEPVSLVATVEWGLVAGSEAPYKSAQDLIAAAKAAPGKINYGSGGNGSPQHIAMALFADRAGVQLTHVPYKGATQAAMGVAGNEIQVAFQGLATVNSLIQAKKLRLIGVTTPRRMTQFPDAPTVSASGLSGFEVNSWFAVMAPAGTPRDIVNRLNAEIVKAMNEPEQRNLLLAQGLTPRGSTAAELGVATREQLAKYQRLIKAANITAE